MSQNHTNDGLPLPDACAHRVLSYLPAQQILSAAATSRRFANVAKAPELWLEVCKSRWPDVRTSAVVARAVRTRGPMAFYRRRVSCSRELSVPTVPLCDLEDLIFTVDMEQGATHLCSVVPLRLEQTQMAITLQLLLAQQTKSKFPEVVARLPL